MTTTFTVTAAGVTQHCTSFQDAKQAAAASVHAGAPVARVHDEEGRLAVTASRGAAGTVTTFVCVMHEGPYVLRAWERG